MIYKVPDNKYPCPELLLHPNIPKPLHGLNPRVIFGEQWWNESRQTAYGKYNFHCHACGIAKLEAKYHKWLEAHECYNINYNTGRVEFVRIAALCHSCHNFIHSGRMERILGNPEMPLDKYLDIIKHGTNILASNKLKKLELKELCDWADWHLIINSYNYGQKFHSYQEWAIFYGQ